MASVIPAIRKGNLFPRASASTLFRDSVHNATYGTLKCLRWQNLGPGHWVPSKKYVDVDSNKLSSQRCAYLGYTVPPERGVVSEQDQHVRRPSPMRNLAARSRRCANRHSVAPHVWELQLSKSECRFELSQRGFMRSHLHVGLQRNQVVSDTLTALLEPSVFPLVSWTTHNFCFRSNVLISTIGTIPFKGRNDPSTLSRRANVGSPSLHRVTQGCVLPQGILCLTFEGQKVKTARGSIQSLMVAACVPSLRVQGR